MNHLRTKLFALKGWQKYLILLNLDFIFVNLAMLLALGARFESKDFLYNPETYLACLISSFAIISVLISQKFYQAITRHMTTEMWFTIIVACFSSSIFLIALISLNSLQIPRAVPFIHAAFCCVFIAGVRYLIRVVGQHTNNAAKTPVAIYGAGATGRQLFEALKWNNKYRVCLFIDDNSELNGKRITGVRISTFKNAIEIMKSADIKVVLLAFPLVSDERRKEIVDRLAEFNIEVQSIPPLSSLITGSASIAEPSNLYITEMLGRKSVEAIPELLTGNIVDKTVLVTGAGGSIGSELCRQIIQLRPKQVMLLDISEAAIYNITTELALRAQQFGVTLVSIVGGVQDRSLIASVLAERKVDTIYHAAAYKHVPLMEKNIFQAIKNNTFGTMILAEEATRAKVDSVTLISTDKAVNPSNFMGASKRLAELICQAMNAEQTATRFSIVRFGNVLGSSGSVVPLFQKQIAAGGPITLTHPNVTRYFMTITEAVQLVIQASAMAKGGEVFVLDMGEPVKIKDLAIKMVQLSGMLPLFKGDSIGDDGSIAIRVTGLRPGEKMHEELSYGDNLTGTTHSKIMMVHEPKITIQDLRSLIGHLENLIAAEDLDGLVSCIAKNAGYVANVDT